MSFTPRASRESADAAIMPPITTKSATGLCLRKIFPRISSPSAMPPIKNDVEFVSLRCLKKKPVFPQKLPCAPCKPKSFGDCVLARKSATPHLNPVITLSEMKWTKTPAFASQAMKAMNETSNAVPAASAPKRIVLPPFISLSDVALTSEMADVTETAVYREPQKIQKTRLPNKQA